MTPEPVYSFVKGQGWVIQTCESVIITNLHRERVRLELRKPENGETYIDSSSDWNLTDWMAWAVRSSNTFKNIAYCMYPKNQRYHMCPDLSFCVLTWLD